MLRPTPCLALTAILLAGSSSARAEEVAVFAAASLSEALHEITGAWEQSTAHRVVLNLGGSNDLARQIRAGAPADLFLSADRAQMDGLEQDGLLHAGDRVDLLSNTLVVVVPAAGGARIASPADLLSLRRLALADPQAVPAGVYARAWLESIGLWSRVETRVVPALNVRAALSIVESENADAGIVYKSDALISKRVRVALEVPRGEGPAIVYPLARLAASRKPAAAALFVHLQSPAARAVFLRLGFLVLGGQ